MRQERVRAPGFNVVINPKLGVAVVMHCKASNLKHHLLMSHGLSVGELVRHRCCQSIPGKTREALGEILALESIPIVSDLPIGQIQRHARLALGLLLTAAVTIIGLEDFHMGLAEGWMEPAHCDNRSK